MPNTKRTMPKPFVPPTPEEMAAKIAADQRLDVSGHPPRRNVQEAGPGNDHTGRTKYTGPGGLPMRPTGGQSRDRNR